MDIHLGRKLPLVAGRANFAWHVEPSDVSHATSSESEVCVRNVTQETWH